MGLLQRLDDLDRRVIGRGDPNWNSPTPKPWTPEVGPLLPVRGTHVPYAWAFSTGGVVVYALMIAFPGDHSYLGIFLRGAWFPFFMIAITVRTNPRFFGAAAPLPPDALIDRSRSAPWTRATVLALALLVLPVVGVVVSADAAGTPPLGAYLLAGGVVSVVRERQVARWEDDHAVELLRARRRRGSRGFYMRKR